MVGQLQVDSRQLRTDTDFEFNKLKSEIEKWFELTEAHIDGQGQSGGYGKGSPHGGHKGIDKTEIAVWKLPEELDKSSFRHWVDAVALQLEMVEPSPVSRGEALVGFQDENLEDEITFYTHNDEDPAPPCDRPEWDSENELSDLHPCLDDISEGETWTEVSNARRRGKAILPV